MSSTVCILHYTIFPVTSFSFVARYSLQHSLPTSISDCFPVRSERYLDCYLCSRQDDCSFYL